MSGRPINEDLSLARFLGEKTYIGATHVRCGTAVRYVSGGGCVHCARVIATEQREALKYLQRANAVNDAFIDATEESDAAEIEIDNRDDDGLDTDDNVEARRRSGIDDDLM
jgi:hypothetical protein